MFIAHLPAGYLATTPLLDRAAPAADARRQILIAGLSASVAPDLDLLYFYLLSDRREVHHAYFPHLPLACVLLLTAAALVLALIRARREAWLAWAVVAANVFLHLLLDSTAGGIRWLWPFSDAELVLAHVTARHRPWYLNFILHWTFALEIVITAAALLLWLWRRRRLT